MIIIDEVADIKLADALETLKLNESDSRCIYFRFKSLSLPIAETKDMILTAVGKHIAAASPYIYLCEDGDIFILAPGIGGKEGKQLIIDVATHLERPADELWVGFYETPLHLNILLSAVEEKLKLRRDKAALSQQEQEQAEKQRKRQSILATSKIAADDIKKRRMSRAGKAEFMIIEDDVFSCRLVENVLQKKYAMTVLSEATHALETYARLAPDLLFLDINLPDVTGHELLEKIMQIDPDAYVIMLSGNADKENIVQAMGKGAKGFVAKPFTRDKLFQYIDRCPTIKHS